MAQLVHRIALVFALELLCVPAAVGCVALPGQDCLRDTPFLVFFDWNSDAVPTDRFVLIEEAAKWWKAGEQGRSAHDPRYLTKMTVDGYTDSSLPAAPSLDLSARMAQHVADVLIKLGVGPNDIVLTAHGDADPRIPTGPGVREPQNRRVEIWFKN